MKLLGGNLVMVATIAALALGCGESHMSDDGGAEMIIHEPEGGGAVFSTSSINWLSSLLVDEHVSRITANVVKRYTT